jgi:hypothetical protein
MYTLTQEEYDALKLQNNPEIQKHKDELWFKNSKFVAELITYFEQNYKSQMYNNFRPQTFEQGIVELRNKYKI